MSITLEPVAFVKNTRTDLSDDYWGSVTSEIELVPGITADAFNGIDEFSHLEIIFYFNQSDKSKVVHSGT